MTGILLTPEIRASEIIKIAKDIKSNETFHSDQFE